MVESNYDCAYGGSEAEMIVFNFLTRKLAKKESFNIYGEFSPGK